MRPMFSCVFRFWDKFSSTQIFNSSHNHSSTHMWQWILWIYNIHLNVYSYTHTRTHIWRIWWIYNIHLNVYSYTHIHTHRRQWIWNSKLLTSIATRKFRWMNGKMFFSTKNLRFLFSLLVFSFCFHILCVWYCEHDEKYAYRLRHIFTYI